MGRLEIIDMLLRFTNHTYGIYSISAIPVTEFSTVYTALHNFQNVSNQLKQESLPLFWDEWGFRIVAETILQRFEEFKNIVSV